MAFPAFSSEVSAVRVYAPQVESPRSKMASSSEMIDNATRPQTMSFEQTLLKAFDEMNAQQMEPARLAEEMIVNPDSVDVHDITIAMSRANLSLRLAQTVVERVVRGWSDLTSAR